MYTCKALHLKWTERPKKITHKIKFDDKPQEGLGGIDNGILELFEIVSDKFDINHRASETLVKASIKLAFGLVR